MMRKEVDVLIVGGGAAGLGAAIGAMEEGAQNVLLVDRKNRLGGILTQCVHSGFGLKVFNQELTGPEFASRLARKIKGTAVEILLNAFVLSLSPNKEALISSRQGLYQVRAKAIIYATGCLERTPGMIRLPGTRPSGVLTAGLAQLYLNEYGYLPGKRAFILGSGDIGLIMARRLSLEGAKVLGVAEIMPYSNGLVRNKVQCLDDFSIPLYLSHTVSKVYGNSHLEGIDLSRVDERGAIIEGSQTHIECDLLLLSVGLLPNVGILKNAGAKIGESKGAAVDGSLMTSLPGIFTAGNSLHVHDLADEAYLEGIEAGKAAAQYISNPVDPVKEATLTHDGNISYLVPSSYGSSSAHDLLIKFRCRRPKGKCSINISCDGEVVKTIKKISMLPSEMEIIRIPKKLLKNNLKTIEVTLEDNL